ncbi:MAG: hypothetical protein M3069_09745, partial [Chloroflexota bacterium]|nr:hypothetical protein [Chloroflexota bacterium]
MEHAPIYRSSGRRASTSILPWRRTASLTSASIALTLSGIALGYQGFTTTATSVPTTTGYSNSTRLDTANSGRNAAAPVPGVPLGTTDGGHPDVVTALSSALIAQFRAAQLPILASAIGPVLEPLMGPPSPAAEAFVVPPMLTEPAGGVELPLDLAAPALVEDLGSPQVSEAVIVPDVVRAPIAPARAQLAAVGVEEGQPTAAAPVPDGPQEGQPQEPVAPVVEPVAPVVEAQVMLDAPAAAPAAAAAVAPAMHTGESPAPQRAAAAAPAAHQAAPAAAKHAPAPAPDEDAQPVLVQPKHAPPAPPAPAAPDAPAPPPPARANANGNGNNGDN